MKLEYYIEVIVTSNVHDNKKQCAKALEKRFKILRDVVAPLVKEGATITKATVTPWMKSETKEFYKSRIICELDMNFFDMLHARRKGMDFRRNTKKNKVLKID